MLQHHRYRYRNLTLLVVGTILAVWLFRNDYIHNLIMQLGNWGYIGAFLGGMMFSSTFTAAPGAVILLVLAEKLSPVEIGLAAGIGAVITDFIIFKYVKDGLVKEVKPIYNLLGGRHLTSLFHTRYFSWTLPVIGAAIIASPLPDELGVPLMGIAKMAHWEFLLVSFLINAVGIFLIVSASLVVRP